MTKTIFLRFALIMVALTLTMNTVAQKDATIESAKKLMRGGEFLDVNYKVTKPMSGLFINDKFGPAAPSAHKATLEIMNFGTDGNTVLIIIDLGDEGSFTFSWSGKNVHVLVDYDDEGTGIFAVVRGHTLCGALLTPEPGKWLAKAWTGSNRFTTMDLKKGMTRAQVETIVSKGLELSQFKFTRNSGNLKVYSLFWLHQEKRYNIFGTDYKYELRNDKKYGDFYFDAQGKLVKWIVFL